MITSFAELIFICANRDIGVFSSGILVKYWGGRWACLGRLIYVVFLELRGHGKSMYMLKTLRAQLCRMRRHVKPVGSKPPLHLVECWMTFHCNQNCSVCDARRLLIDEVAIAHAELEQIPRELCDLVGIFWIVGASIDERICNVQKQRARRWIQMPLEAFDDTSLHFQDLIDSEATFAQGRLWMCDELLMLSGPRQT